MDHLKATLTAPQLQQWASIYEQYGWQGSRRHDYVFATLCMILANVNRAEKTEPIPIESFLPYSTPEPEPEEIAAREDTAWRMMSRLSRRTA